MALARLWCPSDAVCGGGTYLIIVVTNTLKKKLRGSCDGDTMSRPSRMFLTNRLHAMFGLQLAPPLSAVSGGHFQQLFFFYHVQGFGLPRDMQGALYPRDVSAVDARRRSRASLSHRVPYGF